jgi:hypothetical protein
VVLHIRRAAAGSCRFQVGVGCPAQLYAARAAIRREGNARQRTRLRRQRAEGGRPSTDHRTAGRRHRWRPVWAERYDRALTDIFALQDEISEAIVKALKLKLLPEEKEAIARRGTDNVQAYNLVLMARSYRLTGNGGDLRLDEVIDRLCGRAVEIDPCYARAWAQLAHAQFNLH